MVTTVNQKMLDITSDDQKYLTSEGAFSFRNKIVNGSMMINQRGYAGSINAYLADLWVIDTDTTGGTYESGQGTFPLGQELEECANYVYMTRTAASSGGSWTSLGTWVEDVRTFAGKTVTLSFWAKSVYKTNVTVGIFQRFGSGGSAEVSHVLDKLPVSDQWTKYTFTTQLTSVAGKTIGTNNQLLIAFSFPLNATFDFQITAIQLEEGSVATPFEVRPISIEQTLCERYLQIHALTARQQSYGPFAPLFRPIVLPNLMYTTPTVGLWSAGSLGNTSSRALYMSSANSGRFGQFSAATGDSYVLYDYWWFQAYMGT